MSPDGEIVKLSDEDHKELIARVGQHKIALDDLIPLTEEQAKNLKSMDNVKRKNYMRNEPCPCKSGKKFKRCCWIRFKK